MSQSSFKPVSSWAMQRNLQGDCGGEPLESRKSMVKARCTWNPEGSKSINEAVTWCQAGDSSDLEDTVTADNCVLLEVPLVDSVLERVVPSCQLFLSCQPTYHMQNISILCEARTVEIYGRHGEYLETVRTELVEEVDEMVVFRGDVTFDHPLKDCCLKFASLQSKTSMWLYGVRVVLDKSPCPSPSRTASELTDIEQRLASMGIKPSDKAEAVKSLLRLLQVTAPNTSARDQNTSTNNGMSALMPLLQMLQPQRGQAAQHPSQFDQVVEGQRCISSEAEDVNRFYQDSSAHSRTVVDEEKQKCGLKATTSDARPLGGMEKHFDVTEVNIAVISMKKDLEAMQQRLAQVDNNVTNMGKQLMEDINTGQRQNLNNTETSLSEQMEAQLQQHLAKVEERLVEHIDKGLEKMEQVLWEKVNRRIQELDAKLMCRMDELLIAVK